MPLAKWLGASFLRTAVVPACLIGPAFLSGYWLTRNYPYRPVGVIALGAGMALGMVALLLWRARVMSRRLGEPLRRIEALVERIGAGESNLAPPRCGVAEIDRLGERLVAMGKRLETVRGQIDDQQAELRRALDNERRISTGQRRFIQILSHEFRTPLTVIDSCGQILRRRAARLTGETVIERSDMIRHASDRIRDVMRSALQLVQMEDGETTCRPAPVAVGGLLREAASMAQEGRQIEMAIGPEAEHAAVFIDRALVHTALAAIIENACRYSPAGRPVRIAAEVDGDRCRIAVEDQGSGIPSSELPLVTERFFRGSNSTAVPGAGTGLYLASSLIDANGGLLDITSEPGMGTVVTASLPLARATTTEVWEAA